jgi:hypothetical protein
VADHPGAVVDSGQATRHLVAQVGCVCMMVTMSTDVESRARRLPERLPRLSPRQLRATRPPAGLLERLDIAGLGIASEQVAVNTRPRRPVDLDVVVPARPARRHHRAFNSFGPTARWAPCTTTILAIRRT